jgi:hypothetical protein
LIHDLTHSLGLADSQNLRFSLALPAWLSHFTDCE